MEKWKRTTKFNVFYSIAFHFAYNFKVTRCFSKASYPFIVLKCEDALGDLILVGDNLRCCYVEGCYLRIVYLNLPIYSFLPSFSKYVINYLLKFNISGMI